MWTYFLNPRWWILEISMWRTAISLAMGPSTLSRTWMSSGSTTVSHWPVCVSSCQLLSPRSIPAKFCHHSRTTSALNSQYYVSVWNKPWIFVCGQINTSEMKGLDQSCWLSKTRSAWICSAQICRYSLAVVM